MIQKSTSWNGLLASTGGQVRVSEPFDFLGDLHGGRADLLLRRHSFSF